MVDEIAIKGYKSIKSQVVKLYPINVIIGSNGVGKTNFISAFELMRNIYEKQLQSYVLQKGGANVLLYNGRKHTNEISISIELNGSKNRYDVCLAEAQDKLYIKQSGTQFNSYGTWHSQVCDTNKMEASIKDDRRGQAFYVGPLLENFQIYHFHDTGDKSPIKSFSDLYNNRRLLHDGANIASFLYYLKEKHNPHYRRIERMVASVSPYFERFELMPNQVNGQIRLEWKQKGIDDLFFNAYQLSDGTLRFICLATLMMQPNPPKTILIDEPELGLHPKAINVFCEMVKSAAQHSQIIISTQSVNVVDNFSPDHIIVAQQENNATTFRRLSEEKLKAWMEEYSLGELWEMNVIANGYE